MVKKLSSVFYGWWIVFSCFAISLLVGGFVTFGFTAFFLPIANEFGWNYAQISLAASLRGAEVGIIAPLVGLVIDRWGPRRLSLTGIIALGCGLLLLSFTNSLGWYYASFIIIAIGISGLSPTVMMTAVANWFRRRVSIATGIMSCGFAFSGLLIPVVVWLIDILDWRMALLVMGLGMWAIGIPLSLLLRHRPEQYGLLPDGERSETVAPYIVPSSLQRQQAANIAVGARQALKSRVFWHISLALTCQFITISTVVIHVMPYLISTGIATSTASLVAMAVPVMTVSGRLGLGWLGDKFDKKRLTIACFATMVLGLLSFSYASDEAMWLLLPFIIFFGIGWGGNVTMRAAMLREYFGRDNFGAIHGFIIGMMTGGGIVGPLFAGWVFDNWGSYHATWLIFTCLVFVAMIVMATAPVGRQQSRVA